MTTEDLGIVNARIFTGEGFFSGNIYFKDGKVDTLTTASPDCKRVVDAAGCMVLPGLIDPHVHMELTVGQNTSRDDFRRGSVEAALGGVTTLIDFLDPVKTRAELSAAFGQRLALAEKSVVDFGLHACVAQPTEPVPDIYGEVRALGMASVKIFTTYSNTGRRTYDDRIDELLRYSREFGVRLLVHAENDDLVQCGPGIPVRDHERARGVLCELTEVLKLAELARWRDGLLYIVHLNTGSAAARLEALYGGILHKNVVLESCPHYFLLDSSVYERADGFLYTMTPPLRSLEEQRELRRHFGIVDVVATDHCPFDPALKQREFVNEIPMGIGGVKTSLSAMYTLFGDEALPRFTANPARIHGLWPRKGNLLPGADADAVLFDPEAKFRVEEAGSAYRGMELRGRVLGTFSKGVQIVKDGVFVGGTRGEYLARNRAE